MTRIEIDPNVRVRGNGTRAGFEDVYGPIAVNMQVEVFEPESGLVGPGRVTEIDAVKRLVFLSVEWSKLREQAPADAPGDASQDASPVRFRGSVLSMRRSAAPVFLRHSSRAGRLGSIKRPHEVGQASETELVVAAL